MPFTCEFRHRAVSESRNPRASAGGIIGCPNGQLRAVLQLDAIGSPAVVLNPRRAGFPVGRPDAMREHVTWEHEHLRLAE